MKTTNAVKDASMTMPRKLPNFSQQIMESEMTISTGRTIERQKVQNKRVLIARLAP